MSRPPLDSSDETVRLDIRIPKTTMDAIDTARGESSRSAFIRALIRVYVEPKTPALRNLPTSRITGHPYEASPVPPVNLNTAGAPVHRHRYTRGDIVRYEKGAPLYQQTCACGDTRVDL